MERDQGDAAALVRVETIDVGDQGDPLEIGRNRLGRRRVAERSSSERSSRMLAQRSRSSSSVRSNVAP